MDQHLTKAYAAALVLLPDVIGQLAIAQRHEENRLDRLRDARSKIAEALRELEAAEWIESRRSEETVSPDCVEIHAFMLDGPRR